MAGKADERAPGISYWQHQHSGGIILVYENKSDKTLHESLDFNISGLEIEN
jgi:hypothetical protein